MKINILTLFPDMINNYINTSILKKAQEESIVEFNIIDYREYSGNKHNQIDDTPYGGGAGMLIKPEPIFNVINDLQLLDTHKIIVAPTGKRYEQEDAKRLSLKKEITIICGHYEGIDYRVNKKLVDEEISIGDYVLTGGELPACIISDSITRLLEGAIGDEKSHENDSFSMGLLEHPHYTKPEIYDGMKIPSVLKSGNHKHIDAWRLIKSIERTKEQNRDDLINQYCEQNKEDKLLNYILREYDLVLSLIDENPELVFKLFSKYKKGYTKYQEFKKENNL